MADDMTVTSGEPGRAWLAVEGELDITNAARLEQAISEMAGTYERDVEVDFSGVTFLDSSGLAALVRANQSLGALGWRVIVTNPSPVARRVIEISGLGLLMEIRGN